MDQCPQSTPPLNCRPITSERAVIVRPTLKNLCRNYVVWVWISFDIIMFLQTRHQFLVTCTHTALGIRSAGSLWIVAKKTESGDIWQLLCPSFPFVFTLFHTFSLPFYNFFPLLLLFSSQVLLLVIPPLSPSFFPLLLTLVWQCSDISSVDLPLQEDHRTWRELNLPVVFQPSRLSFQFYCSVLCQRTNKK